MKFTQRHKMTCRKRTKKQTNRPGEDPVFFLGGGAPLRSDVTDGEVKKKIKSEYVYTEKKVSSQGGRVCTNSTLPLDPPLQTTDEDH